MLLDWLVHVNACPNKNISYIFSDCILYKSHMKKKKKNSEFWIFEFFLFKYI